MTPHRAFLTVGLLALTLTACDGGGDPVQQALRDTSSANHAAMVEETATTEAVDHAAMGHTTPAPAPTPAAKPFAAVEAEMHSRMAQADGPTLDRAYIAKMIEHHRGAVAMAEVAVRDSTDPEVRRMAQAVIDTQKREIAEMQAWTPATD